jgi:hypothetical protein
MAHRIHRKSPERCCYRVSLWTDPAGQQARACLVCGWGCRVQRPATGKPAFQAAGARQFPLVLLTWDVRALDLSRISRNGIDDGERSKGPVTCAVLTTHRAMEASSMPPLNRRVERGAGTGAQSHAADCSSPGRGELTRTLPDPDGGSCRRGDRPRIPTLLYVLQR